MSEALRLKVHGLDCAEEVAALHREVGPAVGGEDRLTFVLTSRTTPQRPNQVALRRTHN